MVLTTWTPRRIRIHPPPHPAGVREQVPSWFPRALLMTIGGILATLGLLWVVVELGDLLIALLLALFLSFALEPAVQYFSKRRGWKRSTATAVVFLIAGLFGLGFLAAVLTPLISQTGSFFANLPDWLDQVSSKLEEWFGIELSVDAALEDFDSLGSVIQGYADDVGRGVIGFGSTVAGAVLGLLTMGLFTFYLLADGPKLRRSLLAAVRPEVQVEVLRLWEVAIQKTGRICLFAIAAGPGVGGIHLSGAADHWRSICDTAGVVGGGHLTSHPRFWHLPGGHCPHPGCFIHGSDQGSLGARGSRGLSADRELCFAAQDHGQDHGAAPGLGVRGGTSGSCTTRGNRCVDCPPDRRHHSGLHLHIYRATRGHRERSGAGIACRWVRYVV